MNQLLFPNWSSLLVLGLKPARPSKVNSSKMLKLQSYDCACFVTATPILGQKVSQTHFHVMNLSRSAHGTSSGSGTIRLLHTRHKKFRNTNSKETISNIKYQSLYRTSPRFQHPSSVFWISTGINIHTALLCDRGTVEDRGTASSASCSLLNKQTTTNKASVSTVSSVARVSASVASMKDAKMKMML